MSAPLSAVASQIVITAEQKEAILNAFAKLAVRDSQLALNLFYASDVGRIRLHLGETIHEPLIVDETGNFLPGVANILKDCYLNDPINSLYYYAPDFQSRVNTARAEARPSYSAFSAASAASATEHNPTPTL